ncbi:hypothetical protein HYV73_02485 [Candidatus Uhrbacteria bacterium]|nr:hypothetical protein [Candidatus Uhrbacteria bacterium]
MPPLLSFVLDAVALYRYNRATIFGFAGWLIIPVLCSFLVLLFAPPAWQIPLGIMVLGMDVFAHAWSGIHIGSAGALLLRGVPPASVALFSAALVRNRTKAAGFILALLLIGTAGGGILFLVPGALYLSLFSFAIWITLLEGKPGFDAMEASRILFQGRFWYTLWLTIGSPVVLIGSYFLFLLLPATWIIQSVFPFTELEANSPGFFTLVVVNNIGERLLLFPLIVLTHVAVWSYVSKIKGVVVTVSPPLVAPPDEHLP